MSSEKPSAKLHIDDEMKGTADFPLYGERIADILPPEHFLWQLQGSFPGFDDELAGMYRSQRSLKHISEASSDSGRLLHAGNRDSAAARTASPALIRP